MSERTEVSFDAALMMALRADTNITISRNFFKKVVTNTRQTTLTKQKLLSGAKIGGVCKKYWRTNR